jgi:SAM-dependent methyltransferase
MSQQVVGPAQTYDQYLGPAIFHPWGRVLLEHAAPKPGARVLDLACGTGIVTRQVAEAVGEQGKVVGVDLSPDMLAVARSKPPAEGAAIEWREGNAVQLDLPDGAFDRVLCQQGFQFFPDKSAAAREMRRVLSDGGPAVVSVWKGLNDHPVFAALFEAESRHLGVPMSELAVPFSLGDGQRLRGYLEDAGFGRTEVMERSMEVEFPEPERFVQLTVLAGAAVIPELAKDEAGRAALVEAVSRETREVLERHRTGDRLRFAMSSNIAVGFV